MILSVDFIINFFFLFKACRIELIYLVLLKRKDNNINTKKKPPVRFSMN
jgi:hypothetical protein